MIEIFDKNLNKVGSSYETECYGEISTSSFGIKTDRIYIYTNYYSKGEETGLRINLQLYENSINEFFPATKFDGKFYVNDIKEITNGGKYILYYDIPKHIDKVRVYAQLFSDVGQPEFVGSAKLYIIPDNNMN